MPSPAAPLPEWFQGIVIPGPVDVGGDDGRHEVDLSAYFAPEFAVLGAVGLFVIMTVAFVIAMRRRLRRSRHR